MISTNTFSDIYSLNRRSGFEPLFGSGFHKAGKLKNHPTGTTNEENLIRQLIKQADDLVPSHPDYQTCLSKLDGLINENTEPVLSAHYFGLKSRLELLKGQFDEAKSLNNQALEIARNSGNPFEEVCALNRLSSIFQYQAKYPEALETAIQARELADEHGLEMEKALALYNLGMIYTEQLQLEKASEHHFQAADICEKQKETKRLATIYQAIGFVFNLQNNFKEAIRYFLKSTENKEFLADPNTRAISHTNLGMIHFNLGELPTALNYHQQALQLTKETGNRYGQAIVHSNLGMTYYAMGDFDKAYQLATDGLNLALQIQKMDRMPDIYICAAKAAYKIGKKEEALNYLELAGQLAEEKGLKLGVRQVYQAYYYLYKEEGDFEQALKWFERYSTIREELQDEQTSKKIAGMKISFELEQSRKEALVERLRNIELKNAYDELRDAQDRLVRQEKLASLGKLTAGIAHEIQNPLNFVTNFAELSSELVEELRELENIEEMKSVASEISENLDKIVHHGKRASSIVKNMLAHSRNAPAEKQKTNLNKLCEEFLHLAWHGKKSAFQGFNCEYRFEPDPNLPEMELVAQNLGRVILNLLNNSFDAVFERKEKEPDSDYKPAVICRTLFHDSVVKIQIQDNGTGIPEALKEKVFEPFYTSKSAGMGTGLGLSICYDIIKSEGGELRFENLPGGGCLFEVTLKLRK